MDNNSIHYNSFVSAVDNGVFDTERIGGYFRDITKRARYMQSPIKSNSILESFGLSKEDLGDYTRLYIGKALAKDKALPLEDLVCIEDDFSAVFIENDPEEEITLRVTVYKDTKEPWFPIEGSIYYGKLKWYGVAREKRYFEVPDFYAGFVFDGHVKGISEQSLGDASTDLAQAVITAIEQLAYMEREGLLTNIE